MSSFALDLMKHVVRILLGEGKDTVYLFIAEKPLTGFVRSDGELVTRPALSNLVLSKHSDVVGGGGVQLDNGGLVQLG